MDRAARSLLRSLPVVICALAIHASARDRAVMTWPTVNLQVSVDEGVPIPSALVGDSEDIASFIYSRMHVRLSWGSSQVTENPLHRGTCDLARATAVVIIQVAPHAPPSVSNSALAMASPYASSGVRIVVFYERVEPLFRGHSATRASVLGYVLAHEIGHVLEGTTRHSDVGVMKALWSTNDFSLMGRGLLTFTDEDEQQIRVRLTDEACGVSMSKANEIRQTR